MLKFLYNTKNKQLNIHKFKIELKNLNERVFSQKFGPKKCEYA